MYRSDHIHEHTIIGDIYEYYGIFISFNALNNI
jgi:hypothetical protein